MSTTTDLPFDLQLLETIRDARDLEKSGQIAGAQFELFSNIGDEDLMRSVLVLQDILRGLTVGLELEGINMLFEAQHNALLAFSMRFAEKPLVAIYPEHVRWFFEELHAENEDDDDA